jgi:tRNA(adenine34) deaminase
VTDEDYIKAALREAQKAFDAGEVPVGAVIVQNDRIIARGHNQVEQLNDPTAHAEVIALTSAFNFLGSKYLPEATIYVTVEPCLMCAGALYWSKIARVVYAADDEKNGYRRFCSAHGSGEPWPFHPKTALTKGILKDECASLMKEFFRARR